MTKGERLVAITFIQSRIQDPFRRNLLYDLNEVAALEGLKMSPDNYTRLQLVQNQLLRYWGGEALAKAFTLFCRPIVTSSHGSPLHTNKLPTRARRTHPRAVVDRGEHE